MNKYAVITADVVNSREMNVLKNKKYSNIKEYLDYRINELNIKLERSNLSILTKAASSRGDEIQLICKELKDVPTLVRLLRFYCTPLKLRIGIGIGTIDYFGNNTNNSKPLENNSWDMNGEAFYLARKAIDSLKSEKNIATSIKMENSYNTVILQTIYDLLDGYIIKWTESQWKSIHSYIENETYDTAAKELAITAVGVYKNCSSGNWGIVSRAEENLSYILGNMDSKIME